MQRPQPLLAQSLIIGFEHPEPDAGLEELITRQAIGGVILFTRNITSPQQVWRLNRELQRMAEKSAQPRLFIMVDQEGGSVARLREPFTHQRDFSSWGESSEEELRQYGRRVGRELAAAGFNWNLAPVMDVHALADGVMARRSLGGQARRVAGQALAYAQGLLDSGCLACAKHFPGLGRTNLDTHKLKTVVNLSLAELRAMELVPFTQAIAAAIDGIMISHATFAALDPDSPASLSEKVINGLLRQKMGYQGLVLSDDLEMGAVGLDPAQAALRAYLAGSDLLLICREQRQALPALELLEQAAGRGQITPQRLEQSRRRIQAAKKRLLPSPDWPELQKILKI